MKIECTVEELKELIKTPVAGTIDVVNINTKKLAKTLAECRNSQVTK